MTTLTPAGSRVLGVLVEKALTTPAQYPLTLNALINGCNQKNNREPVTNLGEDDVLAALDSLRAEHLVREVLLSGSRVGKFRHNSRETLEIDTSGLVVLIELLLRGPQSAGELRGRASRMHQLESIDVVENLLKGMIGREPPLVRQLPPAPGTRAVKYMQLLCPDLHPTDVPAGATSVGPSVAAVSSSRLEDRLETLEGEVERMKLVMEQLMQSLETSAH